MTIARHVDDLDRCALCGGVGPECCTLVRCGGCRQVIDARLVVDTHVDLGDLCAGCAASLEEEPDREAEALMPEWERLGHATPFGAYR